MDQNVFNFAHAEKRSPQFPCQSKSININPTISFKINIFTADVNCDRSPVDSPFPPIKGALQLHETPPIVPFAGRRIISRAGKRSVPIPNGPPAEPPIRVAPLKKAARICSWPLPPPLACPLKSSAGSDS